MDPYLVLIVSVVLTLGVSACCSLMEAALYAVPQVQVRHLAEERPFLGGILLKLKEEIWKPISAILILNTLANTGGATMAGWAAANTFSEVGVVIFSVFLVLSILYFSEIFPKTVGVMYCRQVALYSALPLKILIQILAPLISISRVVSILLGKGNSQPATSHEEVLSMAAMGTEEGTLDHLEGSVIANVIGLDKLLVKDILTPRVVVFRLEETLQLKDIKDELPSWNFSRVPLYTESDSETLKSYITQRDVYRELLRGGREELPLKELARPLETVPELMRADKLLLQMFEKKEHICAVVDEHGSLAGIITLEDIIEEIVGREIVDEYDTVSDLRTFARILRVLKSKKKSPRPAN